MNKVILGSLAALFIVVEVCMIVVGLSKDKEPPVINIYQENISYTFGCDNEELLKGAVARDKKDGDVTDNMTVSARVEMVKDRLEAVTYAASDKAGNVSTMKVLFVTESDGTYKILPFENYHVNNENLQYSIEGADLAGVIEQAQVIAPSQEATTGGDDQSSEEHTSGEEDTTSSEDVSAGSQGDGATSSDEDETSAVTGEDQTTTEKTVDVGGETSTTRAGYTGTDGKPQIVLAMTETTIKVGDRINWVKFVDEIYDDIDDRNTLFKRIGITKDLDLSVAGDYEQGLYVTDTDGNKSETVTVVVHVVAE